ncbi:MAG: dTDP-4-dehydrorhamnose 3,5-epimerase [Planctomycetota bacterium]|nr:dTDP-4-dehydrorhamnose 3,5-epimerase [Planctomycetota bacterium]
MQIIETAIGDVRILVPRRFEDPRGVFCETYSKRALSAMGIEVEFVQDNHSISIERNVVRGLHFQIPPFAQDKLIRVARGSAFDVVVDLRRASPTFGKHVATVLSADNWRQLLVPAGFAHGFCTLEPNTEVLYKVSRFYSPQHDRGVFWNDPDLGIGWPVAAEDALLSDKDLQYPRLRDLRDLF